MIHGYRKAKKEVVIFGITTNVKGVLIYFVRFLTVCAVSVNRYSSILGKKSPRVCVDSSTGGSS